MKRCAFLMTKEISSQFTTWCLIGKFWDYWYMYVAQWCLECQINGHMLYFGPLQLEPVSKGLWEFLGQCSTSFVFSLHLYLCWSHFFWLLKLFYSLWVAGAISSLWYLLSITSTAAFAATGMLSLVVDLVNTMVRGCCSQAWHSLQLLLLYWDMY